MPRRLAAACSGATGDERTERYVHPPHEEGFPGNRGLVLGTRQRSSVAGQPSSKSGELRGRLDAISRPGWSVEDILDDVLPEHRSLCEAARLLHPVQDGCGLSPVDWSSKSCRDIKNSLGRKRRVVMVTPLRFTGSPPHSPLTADASLLQSGQLDRLRSLRWPTTGLREHALSLWEDKFRRKCLSMTDALFLLAHADVTGTLEGASFLREAQMTYDQVMELEITLITLRGQQGWSHCAGGLPVKTQTSPYNHLVLCDVLARNVWTHSRAFPTRSTRETHLPAVAISRRKTRSSSTSTQSGHVSRRTTQSVKGFPGRFPEEVRSRPFTSFRMDSPRDNLPQDSLVTSSQRQSKESSDLDIRLRSPSRSNSPVTSRFETYNDAVRDSLEWVRDHCMEEVVRSPFSCAMRKRFAVEKLLALLSQWCHRQKLQRFGHWCCQMLWRRCHKQVRTFCRLKCALWVMKRSRTKLEHLVFRVWTRWTAEFASQREDEHVAAVVTIQSWIRGLDGKRAAAVHHLAQAASLIQAAWRGFYCRRMLTRKRRFVAYNRAARQVQHCYRSFVRRVRCATWLRQQRSARIITRSIRRYIEKKRDFLAWCHLLARYHAAIAIQLWIRRTTARIARAKAEREKRAAAAWAMHKFLRRARFLRSFGLRVNRAIERKTAAAVVLQNAYRAKQARARFYELKVQLEGQRRQEILEAMWSNAYATTIQTWWRKRRVLRRPNSYAFSNGVVSSETTTAGLLAAALFPMEKVSDGTSVGMRPESTGPTV